VTDPAGHSHAPEEGIVAPLQKIKLDPGGLRCRERERERERERGLIQILVLIKYVTLLRSRREK
jgi:hypothetical protein